MVWERVAKFESGALYAEMYLRQNQSRGNRKKKRERRDWPEGKRKTPSPRTAIDQRTRWRKIRQKKKKRKNHETDRWDDKIVHRSLNGEKERIEKMLLGRISKAYNFLPSFPALRR